MTVKKQKKSGAFYHPTSQELQELEQAGVCLMIWLLFPLFKELHQESGSLFWEDVLHVFGSPGSQIPKLLTGAKRRKWGNGMIVNSSYGSLSHYV